MKQQNKNPYLIPQRASSVLPEVAKFFGLTEEAIKEVSRKREIVEARMVVCWLETKQNIQVFGKQNYRRTALLFPDHRKGKNMDHATVIHSTKTVHNMMVTYPEFRRKIYRLEKQLFSNVPYVISKNEIDEK